MNPAGIPVYSSLSEAYQGCLTTAYYEPDFVHEAVTMESKVGDENPVTKNPNWYFNKSAKQERYNAHFIINQPREEEHITTRSAARNQIIYEYSSNETVLFDSGDREQIINLSKVWDRIKNPDGTINANYGYMVYHLKDAGNAAFDPEGFTSQWEWAKNRLKLKKETNQAYIHFNRPKDQWNENLDQPCCMYIQFSVRRNQLNLHVNMRSNDLCYGFPYNTLYFVKLMHRMVRELHEVYPELAVGQFYYHATSLHFYLKHKSKVEDMLGLSEKK